MLGRNGKRGYLIVSAQDSRSSGLGQALADALSCVLDSVTRITTKIQEYKNQNSRVQKPVYSSIFNEITMPV